MTISSDNVAKWHRWLDVVEKDIGWVLRQKAISDAFVRVHNTHLDEITKNGGEDFCRSVWAWYGVFAALGVRRHVDWSGDPDNRSLLNFLKDLKTIASEFTFAFYLELFPPTANGADPPVPWQEAGFRQFTDDDEVQPESTLSVSKLQADIEALAEIKGKTEALIDKVYAHLDDGGAHLALGSGLPVFGDFDGGLATIERIALKYLGLFNRGKVSLLPQGGRAISIPLAVG